MTLYETTTVTVTKPVDPRIADLVYFVKHLCAFNDNPATMSDNDLIAAAKSFWDMQHGED